MKIYQNYKKVNSYWYKEIPKHWKKTKNKYVFTQNKILVNENWKEFTLLTMGKSGVNPRNLEDGGKFPSSFENYQKVEPSQLIFCLFDLDETPRTIGISKDLGMITSAYDVFYTTQDNHPNYWNYFYRMVDDYKGLRPYYTGLRKVVRSDTFMGIEVFSPTLKEQKLISNYLDKKVNHIELLIKKIDEKIKLLKEQRTSLISEYVSRGLNNKIERKDSEVNWVGNIPKHWNLKKLKYLVSYNTENLSEDTDDDYSFNYIEISDVDYIEGVNLKEKITFNGSPSRARRVVKPSDVIISTVRTYLRAIGVVPDIQNVICSTGFCVLRDRSGLINQDFLSYVVKSEWFVSFVISNSYGVSYPAINASELVDLKIVLPPLKEQKEIVKKITLNLKKIDDQINLEKKRVDLLKENIQSLICSVVTGKVQISENLI